MLVQIDMSARQCDIELKNYDMLINTFARW